MRHNDRNCLTMKLDYTQLNNHRNRVSCLPVETNILNDQLKNPSSRRLLDLNLKL